MSLVSNQISPGPTWAVLSEPTPSSSPSVLMPSDTDVNMGDDENEEAEIENVLSMPPVPKRKADENPSNRAHKVPRHNLYSHPIYGHASTSQPVNVGTSTLLQSVSAFSGNATGLSRSQPSRSISANQPRSSSASAHHRPLSSTQDAGASSSSRLPPSRPGRTGSSSSSSLDLETTLTQTAKRLDTQAKEKEKGVAHRVVARKRVNQRPRVSTATLLQQAQQRSESADDSAARTRIRRKRIPLRLDVDSFKERPRPLDIAAAWKRRVSGGVGVNGSSGVVELTDSDADRRRVSSIAASRVDPIIISSGSEDGQPSGEVPVSTSLVTTPSNPRPSVSSQLNGSTPLPRKRYKAPSSFSKPKSHAPPPRDAEIILISDSDDVAAPLSAPAQVPNRVPTPSNPPPQTLDAPATVAALPRRSPAQPASQASRDDQFFEPPPNDAPVPEGFGDEEFDFAPVELDRMEVGMDENRDPLSPSMAANLLSPRPPSLATVVSSTQHVTNPMDKEEENMFDSYINMDQATEEGMITDRQEADNSKEGPLPSLDVQQTISSTPEEGQILSSTPQEKRILLSAPEEGEIISPTPERGQIIPSSPEEGQIVSPESNDVLSRSAYIQEDGEFITRKLKGHVCSDREGANVEMGDEQGGLGGTQVGVDPNDIPSAPDGGGVHDGNVSDGKPETASPLSLKSPEIPSAFAKHAVVSPARRMSTPSRSQCQDSSLSASEPRPASTIASSAEHPASLSLVLGSSQPIMSTLSHSHTLAIPAISALNVRFKRPSTENGDNVFFSRALVARKPSTLSLSAGTPVPKEQATSVGDDTGKPTPDVNMFASTDGSKSTAPLALNSASVSIPTCPLASPNSQQSTQENSSTNIKMHSPPLPEPQAPRSEPSVIQPTPASKGGLLRDVSTQEQSQSQVPEPAIATATGPPVPTTRVSSRPSIAPPRVPPPLVNAGMTLAEAINSVREQHLARSSLLAATAGKKAMTGSSSEKDAEVDKSGGQARKKKRIAKSSGVDRANSASSTRQSTPSDASSKLGGVRTKTPSLDNLRSLLGRHPSHSRSVTSDSQSNGSASRATSSQPPRSVFKKVVQSPTAQRRLPPGRNSTTFESFISPVRTRDEHVSASVGGNGIQVSPSLVSRSPQNRRKSAAASFERFIVRVPPASPVSPAESQSFKRQTNAPPPRSRNSGDDADKLLELAGVHLGSEKSSNDIPDRHVLPKVLSTSVIKGGGTGRLPRHVQVDGPSSIMEVPRKQDITSQKTLPPVPQNARKHDVYEYNEVVSESEISWDANVDQSGRGSSLADYERQPSENLMIPDDSSASRSDPEKLVGTDLNPMQQTASGRPPALGHRWRQTAKSQTDSNEDISAAIPANSIAAGSEEAEFDDNVIAPAVSHTASSGSLKSTSSAGGIPPASLDVIRIENRPRFDFGAQEFIGGYPVVTWRSHAAAQRLLPPKYHLAKDLPHSLQDRMNALPIEYRNSDFARIVFEAVIQEAMDDEPDAPPIEIYQNDIGEETTPPWEFVYTNHMWYGEGVPPPDIKNLKSCGCVGRCDPKSKTCACAKRQYEWVKPYIRDGTFPASWPGSAFVYDSKGFLQLFGCPIFECNQFCDCDDDCPNRVIQNGRKWPVNIVRTERKGWGVFAGAKKIPKGAYLGIYAGELLTDPEGEERGKHYNAFGRTYLFTIDFHYLKLDMENPDLFENLYVVDAYHAGNFTRFLNHSCDPNCQIFASYINEADINKPLLTFFTIRDVDPWEELCFSYWGDIESKREEIEEAKANGERIATDAVYAVCQCGSDDCLGRLF